ncbi:MAG: hypothetical protein ACRERE_02870 [Candidatus Entotheonellia bacterium]
MTVERGNKPYKDGLSTAWSGRAISRAAGSSQPRAAEARGHVPKARTGGRRAHRRPTRRRVREKALKACTDEVRHRTFRTRGESLVRVVGDLRRDLDGWYPSVGFAAAPARFKELDSWSRRRRRCSLGTPWGRCQDRERRRRGGSRDLAWNTVTSAQGPWRLSRRPALAIALPGGGFDALGLPRRHRGS